MSTSTSSSSLSLFGNPPAHWEVTSLEQLCLRGEAGIQVGVRMQHMAEAHGSSSIPNVMPKNIRDERIDHSDISRVSFEPSRETDRYKLIKGDILFIRYGDLKRRALVSEREEGWLLGSGCIRIRFSPHSVDPLFAFYQLGHPAMSKWLLRHMSSAVTPQLNTAILRALPWVLPPLAEQREIAEVLHVLEQKIELNNEVNRSLLAVAHAIFDALVKRPLEDSESRSRIPSGWRMGNLQNCCGRIENGRTPLRSEPRYWSGNVPWLTSAEVRQPVVTATDTKISREGLLNSSLKIWPRGTTVVAMFGATAGQAAWMAMEACANQACCGLVPARHMQTYVYLHLASSTAALQQLTRGSAQQNLNQQTIAQFPIPIPDDATLKSFDESVRPLLEKVAANCHESSSLAALRDKLLPRLFSGEAQATQAEWPHHPALSIY